MVDRKVKSIVKAMKIMELFNIHRRELSILEISNYMDMSKSTVHGIVSTLLDLGYIKQNSENSKYSLGFKIITLSATLIKMTDITMVSKKHLYNLAFDIKETVHLAILSDYETFYIDKVEPAERITLNSEIGRRVPAHCTGIGKVLLASLPRHEIEYQLKRKGMKRFTENTITDIGKLSEELDDIKKDGVGMDREEIEEGLTCIAAPIYNHSSDVIAAVSIAGPTVRIENKKDLYIEKIKNTATEISKELGYNS